MIVSVKCDCNAAYSMYLYCLSLSEICIDYTAATKGVCLRCLLGPSGSHK